VWSRVVAEISVQHSIRSAWLDGAREVSEDAGHLRVVFPESSAKLLRTPMAAEQGQLIEELWVKFTGRKVAFRPEATAAVVADDTAKPAPSAAADDFENDPGIEAAIELFSATLEPEETKKS
jgi:hypothetical protein